MRTLSLQARLEGHEGCVNCATWDESGTFIVSGSDDTLVRCCEVALGAAGVSRRCFLACCLLIRVIMCGLVWFVPNTAQVKVWRTEPELRCVASIRSGHTGNIFRCETSCRTTKTRVGRVFVCLFCFVFFV